MRQGALGGGGADASAGAALGAAGVPSGLLPLPWPFALCLSVLLKRSMNPDFFFLCSCLTLCCACNLIFCSNVSFAQRCICWKACWFSASKCSNISRRPLSFCMLSAFGTLVLPMQARIISSSSFLLFPPGPPKKCSMSCFNRS